MISFINGESMVSVKGNVNTTIASISQLGLSDGSIRVSPEFRHKDLMVDAWGAEMPADVQFKLAAVRITMTLIHFDRTVMDQCIIEGMAGAGGGAVGALARAGLRMGGGNARFAANNHYIGLNIASPISSKPWRFYYAYLAGTPMEFPLGVESSIVTLNWRAVPYTTDPWGGGTGSAGVVLWDHTLDT